MQLLWVKAGHKINLLILFNSVQAYGIEAHNYIVDENGTWLMECYLNIVQWSIDTEHFGLLSFINCKMHKIKTATITASVGQNSNSFKSQDICTFCDNINIDVYSITTS